MSDESIRKLTPTQQVVDDGIIRHRQEAFCLGYRQALVDAQSWLTAWRTDPLTTSTMALTRLVGKLSENADRYDALYEVAPQLEKALDEATAGLTHDLGDFSQHLPRLLDCGMCYEEDGEEVHPHPECPVGRPAADSPNPLVSEIAAELEKVDGMVDDMIAFVLRHATARIRQTGNHHCECCLAAAALIDPDGNGNA